jgi:hypothetical protein
VISLCVRLVYRQFVTCSYSEKIVLQVDRSGTGSAVYLYICACECLVCLLRYVLAAVLCARVSVKPFYLSAY